MHRRSKICFVGLVLIIHGQTVSAQNSFIFQNKRSLASPNSDFSTLEGFNGFGTSLDFNYGQGFPTNFDHGDVGFQATPNTAYSGFLPSADLGTGLTQTLASGFSNPSNLEFPGSSPFGFESGYPYSEPIQFNLPAPNTNAGSQQTYTISPDGKLVPVQSNPKILPPVSALDNGHTKTVSQSVQAGPPSLQTPSDVKISSTDSQPALNTDSFHVTTTPPPTSFVSGTESVPNLVLELRPPPYSSPTSSDYSKIPNIPNLPASPGNPINGLSSDTPNINQASSDSQNGESKSNIADLLPGKPFSYSAPIVPVSSGPKDVPSQPLLDAYSIQKSITYTLPTGITNRQPNSININTYNPSSSSNFGNTNNAPNFNTENAINHYRQPDSALAQEYRSSVPSSPNGASTYNTGDSNIFTNGLYRQSNSAPTQTFSVPIPTSSNNALNSNDANIFSINSYRQSESNPTQTYRTLVPITGNSSPNLLSNININVPRNYIPNNSFRNYNPISSASYNGNSNPSYTGNSNTISSSTYSGSSNPISSSSHTGSSSSISNSIYSGSSNPISSYSDSSNPISANSYNDSNNIQNSFDSIAGNFKLNPENLYSDSNSISLNGKRESLSNRPSNQVPLVDMKEIINVIENYQQKYS